MHRLEVVAACRHRSWLAVATLLVAVACVGNSVHARQRLELPPEVRAAMLRDCMLEVAHDVRSDGRDKGFGDGGEATLLEEEAVFLQGRKDRITIDGPGQFRFGPDYLPQPMTFSCEWDSGRKTLRKGGYKAAREADTTALPPQKATAVGACRREVREEMERMARSRSYYSPTLTMRPGVRFEQREGGLALHGGATYKLDSSQARQREVEYRCEWNAEDGRLGRIEARPEDPWRRDEGVVTCESRNMASRTCSAPIGGWVRVDSNLSDTRCAQGVNWSHSSREIRVWDGCRARFTFEMR